MTVRSQSAPKPRILSVTDEDVLAEIIVAGRSSVPGDRAMLVAVSGIDGSGKGYLSAIFVFSTTVSFLITTPGSFVVVEGFLVPSEIGAFLVKDVFLLGAAFWTAGEALDATTGSC